MKTHMLNVASGCQCGLCQRHQRINEIKAKLPPEDAAWLETFANVVLDEETEHSMQRAYAEELLSGITCDLSKLRATISK